MAFILRSLPMKAVDSYSYHSNVMNADYDIVVGLPHTYDANPDKTYPALVILDGNWHFSCVNLLARGLLEEVVDIIVIGVDIPIEVDEPNHTKRRVHQFSPDNHWPMTDDFGSHLRALLKERLSPSELLQDCIGGAPHFLKFIKQELLPGVSDIYRINNEDIGLAGNSAAGFFTAHTLFSENSPFHKYIISSPAMAYGDGELFRLEKRWAQSHSDLAAQVYMGAGARELNNVFYEGWGQIVSGMSRLTGALTTRNYPSLTLWSDIYSRTGHIDSLFVTAAEGLRRLYAKQ